MEFPVKIRPVILCGGGGTRLWPISTENRPKQFLNLLGSQSMLADTAQRVNDSNLFRKPLAIGAARHEKLIHDCLPIADILLEPVSKNSAAPIAAACLLSDPNDLMLVLPADHHISKVSKFHSAIRTAISHANSDKIVTFGITPEYPATGYGYIKTGGRGEVLDVHRFIEKPDAITAGRYFESGNYYWNAGIFMFKVNAMLDAFVQHAPDIFEGVNLALADGRLSWAEFTKVRSESIDYAVLERTSNLCVVPVDMGWSDVGEFGALHNFNSKNSPLRNSLKGQAAVTESSGLFVHAQGVRVAAHGVKDIAVVATPENVLVTSISDASGIKPVVSKITSASEFAIRADQREWLQNWLWNNIMAPWSELAMSKKYSGCIETVDLNGVPEIGKIKRGRVAPRQLYTFANAKRLGWNNGGAADAVIEGSFAFIDGPSRLKSGGWAHSFDLYGEVLDARRDLYDHTFIALAGCELAKLGDKRGSELASEAFDVIDNVFVDCDRGWHDPETAPGIKKANPHMHLLEASLAQYSITADRKSFERIEKLCVIFEKNIFDPIKDAVIEEFNHDWSRQAVDIIEPGHCYEWAFLLSEAERLIGRDTASWRRRLINYAESNGIISGVVVDRMGSTQPTFRLWPQLERVRALLSTPQLEADVADIFDLIIEKYLKRGPSIGWADMLGGNLERKSQSVPASMLYHLMTGIAYIVPPPK